MFVRNCWYVAGWSDEFTIGSPQARTIIDQPIVLYRTPEGDLVAMEDRCVHRGAPLSAGRCEGSALRCLYHGLKFDRTGICVEIPGQEKIPDRARVRTFAVEDRHGWAWLWMGNAEAADTALIPAATGIDNPDWRMGRGEEVFAAEYNLLNDNLLDFSHLSYVHRNSFKADEKWATERPTVTVLDRGVRVQRWIANAPAIASARDLGGTPVDTWSSYEFLIPGILLMETTFCSLGTAEASDFGPPVGGILRENRSSQAITPISARSTRYLFCIGSRASDASPEDADATAAVARMAFLEDRAMIESQQEILDKSPGFAPMPTTADKAIVHFQRIMKRLSSVAG
jgi:phenylpropionate dioxygenase-like ring-hydroxylating dioxygenase large terminal subunit